MIAFQYKILVADDGPEDLRILSKVLESQGYEVQTAQTGAKALALALASLPDLILLDVMMPEMEGYEVCRRLKVEPQTREIPVIFISGLNEMADKVSAFSAGAVDYVLKPFDAAEVLVRVQTHLTLRQTQKQLQAANGELSRRLEELARSEAMLQQYRDHLEQLVDERTAAYRRLMTAVEQMAESLVITDARGDILYVNPAFEQITGYSREEALGHNPRLLKSEKHPPAFYQQLWETISTGKVWTGRIINRRKDGVFITEESVITPVRDDNGKIVNYVCVKRDVTEALRLEEQYYQSQKMESIGRLAGGVAHDFNNLLTSIIGHTSLALELLPPETPIQSDLEVVLQNAERAASLTRQLLAFARRQVIEPRLLNLNELILNMDKMLRRLIGEDIELVTLVAPDLGWVRADAGQIEQILLNLAVNARDAMPEGGRLTLETANLFLEEPYTRQHHAQIAPGEYVLLAVSDTGTGMSEAVQAHLFEPFFTTKAEGQGTGLGLATCFGIIKQNNGHIWYQTEPGQGTRFMIYLPRDRANSAALEPQGKLPWISQGTETILLVEDDQPVRVIVARTLREQGYTLLEAGNAVEALALFQYEPLKIDLLVTDVVMPGLNGKALAEQALAARPGLKVLFISGYTDNVISQKSLGVGADFMQKPFSPGRLAEKVREILDRKT